MKNAILVLLLCSVGFLRAQIPLAASFETGNPTCNGDSSGYISVFPLGGNPPYVAAIDSGAFTRATSFRGLAAGTYLVRIFDANFDTVSYSLTLTDPPPLAISITDSKGETCHRDRTGRISVDASGGSAPYRFAIDNGVFTNGNVFKDLAGGIHIVEVLDSQDCQEDTLTLVMTPPPVDGYVEVLEEVQCTGDSNARIHIVPTGGTGNYVYGLNESPLQVATTFEELGGGTYTITIQDDSGCVALLPLDLVNPEPVAFSVDVDSIACAGDQNGRIIINGQGGSAPYAYDFEASGFSFINNFPGLGEGTYLLQIRDIKDCFSAIDSVVLTQPAAIEVVLNTQDLICKGDQSGALSARITGGTPPYQYAWDGQITQQSLDITGLNAGNHYLAVTDQNGCSRVDTTSLSEPAEAVALSLVSVIQTVCERTDGRIVVEANGGNGPYTYTWPDIPAQVGNDATGLGAGTYTVIAQDEDGCQDSLSVEIETTFVPTAAITTFPNVDNGIRITEGRVRFMGNVQFADSVAWDFGDGSPISTQSSPTHVYDSIGTFQVRLRAWDEDGLCPAEAIANVVVLPIEQLHIPNAFSPNMDGSNDLFRVAGEEIAQMQVSIFNRWGRMVARLSSTEDVWDGTNFNGQQLPTGVYTYMAQITFVSGYQRQRGGTISLIR